MNIFVADACAVIAYLFDEVGADVFENLLIQVRQKKIGLIIV